MSLFKEKFPHVPTKDDASTPKSLSVALGVARQQKQRAVLPQNRPEEKPAAPKYSSVAEAILAKRKAAQEPIAEEGEELSDEDLLNIDLEEGLEPEDSLENDMDMVSAIRKRMKERRGG